jgi:hypothetical protein
MFCPGCGTQELAANQFCRGCGANMMAVRNAIEKPDSITASAANAREEIGRAVAQKIRETKSAKDLNLITEEALPNIEKFLESPEERRLRRIRTGSLIAFIGLGATIAFSIVGSIAKDDFLVMAGMGFVAMFVGIAFVVNGLLFSVPKRSIEDRSSEGLSQRDLDLAAGQTNDLILPESRHSFTSVTDETTQNLREEVYVKRS